MSTIEQFQLDPKIEYIKIHGLQRTATNYVSFLIDQNFTNTKSLVNAGGWKHGYYCAPWTLGQEVHVAVVVKNPYAWLVSLYDYWKTALFGPDLTDVSFEAFVRSPVVFEEAAGTPFFYRTANPVQHWNGMNFHWITLQANSKKICVVHSEALIHDAEGMVLQMAEYFGLKMAFDGPLVLDTVVPPTNETPTAGDKLFGERAAYYKEGKFFERYTRSLVDFVNSQLDPAVLSMTGYQKV